MYDLSGRLLSEDDARSNQSSDYVSLNGSLVAIRRASLGGTNWTTAYEHTDALRSPVHETDVNANPTTRGTQWFTPFGEPSNGSYLQGPGYTGHISDAASHLTYAQQRYYDPVLGRFLSADPVQADDKGGDFNRYWYANDNPYRFTHPDGRDVGFAFQNGATVWDAVETIGYLSLSPTFRGEMSQIINSKNHYTLQFDSGNDVKNGYNHDNRTATINPRKGLLVRSTGKIQSAAIGAGHEISHAAEHDRIGTAQMIDNLKTSFTFDGVSPDGKYTFRSGTSREEDRATSMETRMARELGDIARSSYHDELGRVNVASPTSTESCNGPCSTSSGFTLTP
ncbi:MAG: RHS repeat-associated core domain-containing protein [Proteobacteria bacterium]|nr:RHS repeat-associated core domain-containing protein [Pseudomonadota bacterium]